MFETSTCILSEGLGSETKRLYIGLITHTELKNLVINFSFSCVIATQPALGLHSSLSTNQLTYQMVPTLTNHIVASTQPRLATSLNSSLSPATGISPLRPSPVLSLSPVSPALGAQALGHSQQLATAAQVSFTSTNVWGFGGSLLYSYI